GGLGRAAARSRRPAGAPAVRLRQGQADFRSDPRGRPGQPGGSPGGLFGGGAGPASRPAAASAPEPDGRAGADGEGRRRARGPRRGGEVMSAATGNLGKGAGLGRRFGLRRNGLRLLLMLLVPLALVIGAGYFYITGGRYISTDDAYVQADMVAISADVGGRVTAV